VPVNPSSPSQTQQSPKPVRFRLSARLIVVGLVMMTACVTSGLAIGLQYYFSRSMAIENALVNYQMTAQNTGEFIDAIETRAIQVTGVVAKYPLLLNAENESPQVRDLFAQVMRNTNMFYSIYLGLPNGNFYEVINLDNSQGVRQSLKANPEDRWVVNRVSEVDGKRTRQLDFFDNNFTLRATRYEASNYDPRSRPWFKDAHENAVEKSPPYLFQYLQIAGQTYSIRLPATNAVLGIDITLQSFSEHLQQQPLSAEGEIFIYRKSGEILASNIQTREEPLPAVKPLKLSHAQRNYLNSLGTIKISNEMDWPPIDFAIAGQPKGYSVDMIRLIAKMLDLDIEFINGYSWFELMEKFKTADIHIAQPITSNASIARIGTITDPIINLPYALAIKAGAEKIESLEQLHGKTIALPVGWSLINTLRTAHPDIHIIEVSSTRAALEAVRNNNAYATLDSAIMLRYAAAQYFIDDIEFHEGLTFSDTKIPTDFHLVVQPEMQELVSLINLAIQKITPEQRLQIQKKWMAPVSPEIPSNFAIVPYKELLNNSSAKNSSHELKVLTLKGQKYFAYVTPLGAVGDANDYFSVVVSADNIVQESLDRIAISILISGACLLLLLPLCWWVASPVVKPINHLFEKSIHVKDRQYQHVRYHPSVIKEIDELSHAMVDMAGAIQKYELEQRELMEAFIKLIAEAIDHKSPYTGGHCERVPELALMLVDAAVASTAAPFKDFSFKSEDEYREFRVAAWLHDCGKITVPEHIVDKGSKLETIYNRIHEVRMRFEVLWRDAEITYLKAIAFQPEAAAAFKTELEQQREKLQNDFAFIAKANVGGEFFNPADQERLHAIAQTTWQRHFDDRLGISPIEELRVSNTESVLPAQEYLLANKPEHIVPHTRSFEYHAHYNINMDIPEHLYNLGEIYNLTIARGTLTAEDRFKINEHMISTIRMLEGLPFPAELARVPRYASTHHENMKGTGYPRKLKGEELSIPERILAVADIFEALTAADRPYKKAKPVSEAIAILYKMMLDNHIDRDVFELFLVSGTYKNYAQRYLSAAQIDEVDVEQYLMRAS
jgi:HD-GYP domain-containing protein (c-di-GMP phosphodiesterase class II)/ABC-type amino acid transport substrate-binding protein